MKQSYLFVLLMFLPKMALASEPNGLYPSDSTMTIEVQILERTMQSLQQEVKNQNRATSRELEVMKRQLAELESQRVVDLDSLGSSITALDKRATELGGEIITTKKELSEVDASAHQQIKTRTLYGVIIALSLLVAGLLIYLWTRKRLSKGELDLGQIKDAQTKLQEESLKLDQKLIELLERQVEMEKARNKTTGNEEVDHSLVKKVADEIARIELNLSRMDKDIRGYKQLLRGVERIKNNFLAKGYEIIDMLGKPYNEGMKAITSFVIDETQAKGSQIITGITKPQINYHGKMIQAAEITVSQNI